MIPPTIHQKLAEDSFTDWARLPMRFTASKSNHRDRDLSLKTAYSQSYQTRYGSRQPIITHILYLTERIFSPERQAA